MSRDIKVIQYFGLTYDESRRVSEVESRFVGRGCLSLLDQEITRADCVTCLKEQAIPHEAPRSTCAFCPVESNFAW